MARGNSTDVSTGVRRKLGKPVVLFLEDDVDSRTIHAIALRDAGLDVSEAGSIGEARLVLGDVAPEVIIADRTLPDGDGFVDFVASLRRDPRFADTPCIAFTGATGAKDIEDAVLAGCDVYLVKPISPEVVVARVREQIMARATGVPTRRRRSV